MDKQIPVKVKLMVDGTMLPDGSINISTSTIKGLDVLDMHNEPTPYAWRIRINRFVVEAILDQAGILDIKDVLNILEGNSENNQA